MRFQHWIPLALVGHNSLCLFLDRYHRREYVKQSQNYSRPASLVQGAAKYNPAGELEVEVTLRLPLTGTHPPYWMEAVNAEETAVTPPMWLG
jgi:hypothetical protein